MRKKITNKEIEEKIMKIINGAGWSPLSIRKVTLKLKEDYDIRLNPQLVKIHLFKLKKEGKIE